MYIIMELKECASSSHLSSGTAICEISRDFQEISLPNTVINSKRSIRLSIRRSPCTPQSVDREVYSIPD